METTLCAFGCGRAAICILKNGKQVCAASANQCPVMRQRNSAALRGNNPFADRPLACVQQHYGRNLVALYQ